MGNQREFEFDIEDIHMDTPSDENLLSLANTEYPDEENIEFKEKINLLSKDIENENDNIIIEGMIKKENDLINELKKKDDEIRKLQNEIYRLQQENAELKNESIAARQELDLAQSFYSEPEYQEDTLAYGVMSLDEMKELDELRDYRNNNGVQDVGFEKFCYLIVSQMKDYKMICSCGMPSWETWTDNQKLNYLENRQDRLILREDSNNKKRDVCNE